MEYKLPGDEASKVYVLGIGSVVNSSYMCTLHYFVHPMLNIISTARLAIYEADCIGGYVCESFYDSRHIFSTAINFRLICS